ncbi:MAG: hypothetical protein KGI71_03540, partial [Patescibacteria group bacterium]|nr:hypothetical protein [Patescibacteria group bacterium]
MHKRSIFLLLFLTPLLAFASDPSSASYEILTPTVSSGGYATSTNFSLVGILSPFVANGSQSSASFSARSGFPAYPFVSTPIVSATAGNASVSLSWTTATGFLGWTPSGYSVGQSTTVGGPYSFTGVGNVLSATQTSLANGTAYHFVIRVLDAFSNVIATSSEVSATPVAPPPSSPGGGGGGGGGGGSIVSPESSTGGTVNFSGRAYPGSTITLLKDAQVAASSVADSNANFQMTLSGLSTGNYIFSLYSEDINGNRSSLLTFPVSVTAGATTNIGGIFIAPTINVDKSEVKQGDNLSIFGQSSPGSTITIAVHSNTPLFVQTPSDSSGAYLYTLDTSVLDLGNHLAQSKAALADAISSFSPSVGFLVGDQNIAKQKTACRRGDLNCDGHVNLVDFSIMLY